MDKGLFSFVDVKHGTWPVILVTNPKPAETVQPSKEPTVLMATSSYIRLLLYSSSPIKICEVKCYQVFSIHIYFNLSYIYRWESTKVRGWRATWLGRVSRSTPLFGIPISTPKGSTSSKPEPRTIPVPSISWSSSLPWMEPGPSSRPISVSLTSRSTLLLWYLFQPRITFLFN